MAIIEAVPRGNRELVFGRTGGGFNGWDAAKKKLDARIAARTGKPLAKWVIHELRHSVTTHLVESRRNAPGEKPYSLCAPHIAEAITNHLSGHQAGIGGSKRNARRSNCGAPTSPGLCRGQSRNRSGAKRLRWVSRCR